MLAVNLFAFLNDQQVSRRTSDLKGRDKSDITKVVNTIILSHNKRGAKDTGLILLLLSNPPGR